jgi:hypothetical protein
MRQCHTGFSWDCGDTKIYKPSASVTLRRHNDAVLAYYGFCLGGACKTGTFLQNFAEARIGD